MRTRLDRRWKSAGVRSEIKDKINVSSGFPPRAAATHLHLRLLLRPRHVTSTSPPRHLHANATSAARSARSGETFCFPHQQVENKHRPKRTFRRLSNGNGSKNDNICNICRCKARRRIHQIHSHSKSGACRTLSLLMSPRCKQVESRKANNPDLCGSFSVCYG